MRPLATLIVLLLASAGQAHFHMLIPDKPSAKKGEEVTVTCRFGHPFESELSNMLAPKGVTLISPDGKEIDVTKKVEKVPLKGVKGNVDGYRLRFEPAQRGDYVIVLTSAPTPLPGDKVKVEDTVNVVVHVQAQKGWDNIIRRPDAFLWDPMTRPYGLLPNCVFQARIHGDGTNYRGRKVELERYNPTPPKELPADEFITRTMKTDRESTVTTNLPEAGWWCLTATEPDPTTVTVDGKAVEVTRRATLWVHVDKSAPVKPAE